jgi:predicted nuclease of predicted toxin-antitoxin system
VIVITKDSDFVELLERHGSPPEDHLAHLRQYI